MTENTTTAAPAATQPEASEIWAAAQLAPGEGIEDGVARIAALIAPAAQEAEPAVLPIAAKTHGAWDGLELLDELPDGTELYAHPPRPQADAGAAPEGWRLVPVEPTDAQVDAGYAAYGVAGCYAAMIDAAPQAPAAATESVLIDGVAYQTPAPVAAELLRLHLERRAAPAAAVAPAEYSSSDDVCAWSVWWTHHKARYTTPRQAALAAWGAALERARAAAPTQEADDGWMPIETAPKDGRVLLLGYYNAHGKWRTLRGEWVSEDQIAEYWEVEAEPGWYETSVEAEDPPNAWPTNPTHWRMPPAPPAARARQEGGGA